MPGIASPSPTHAPSTAAVDATSPQLSHPREESRSPSLSPPPSDDLDDIFSLSLSDLPSGTEANKATSEKTRQVNGAHVTPKIDTQPNGHTDTTTNGHDDGPPAKRRRLQTSTPPPPNSASRRSAKPVSPPWKKIEADGPSSFTEGGRRKSGRINTIPLELQNGDKRITRRALHSQQPSPPSQKHAVVNGHAAQAHGLRSASGGSRGTAPAGKNVPPKPPTPTKQPARKTVAQEQKPAVRKSRRRSPSPIPTPVAARTSTRSGRNLRNLRDSHGSARALKEEVPTRTTPRIKIRPHLESIPLVHPGQAKVRPKVGPNFEEYFEHAGDIPVEEGGMLAPDDDPRFTDDMIVKEASWISRIEKEVEDGGLLAASKCSAFEPEPAEEPPRQWAHIDHLVKAMTNFRKLMLIEQQRHRAAAKKLAEACRDEWIRRQPKTAEEIEEEARNMWMGRYRVVMRAMSGMWENVKAEINKRRLEEWEAEEQRRVKAALQEAVNISEQKLQARRAHLGSEGGMSDEDEEDMTDADMSEDENLRSGSEADVDEDDVSGEDESNMSSSDEEGDEDANSVLSDEGLTQDQLKEKYANLPNLETTAEAEAPAAGGSGVEVEPSRRGSDADSTTDESVDMDDDLGSTDMDGGDDDEDGSDGDGEESNDEDEPSGLLGLFFNKSELKRIKDEAKTEDSVASKPPADEDVEMADANAAGDADGDGRQDGPEAQQQADATRSITNANGTLSPPERNTAPAMSSGLDRTSHDDAAMADRTFREPSADGALVVGAITPPTQDHKQASPETDAVTTAASPGQSQSPRTSETKPSDLDTPPSVELLAATKDVSSRSTSPQPGGPKTEIPFLLRGTLREYQHYGLDWLAGLYANNTNGILADEMGLGKTIQTIALLAHLACHYEVWGPHLIIVPTSVMLNWEMEFKKWCPGFKILTYYGNQEERKRKRQGWTNDDIWNVCITSYQIVLQDQQVFRRRRWHYMILDEAHNIKNFKSQRWQTLLGFNTHSRLLLTGTPLQNNLTELWSLLFFLMPPENGEGGFADLREFHDWFHKPESQILESGREQMDEEARATISKLHKVLRPYLLRRLKADVEKQMPAKYEHVEFCRLSKRQRELYDGFLARSETRETLSSGNYLSIINCLMQLRKVCNHPDLFVDRPIMTSFRMQRSVAAEYEPTEQLIRRRLLDIEPMRTVSLNVLNLIPTEHESMSGTLAADISQLAYNKFLVNLKDSQQERSPHPFPKLDAATVKSSIVCLENAGRWERYDELRHCVYLNALRRQQYPIYGKSLVNLLTIGADQRPRKPRPKVPKKIMEWFETDSFLLRNMIPTVESRAGSMEMTITKFACVTPAVVTRDMNKFLLGARGVESFEDWDLKLSAPVKTLPFMPRQRPIDPWHEARMRLTIQFPDKRLLQYDCGKLQALDKLLRKLQAGGHRALIFTQMTKVLDILELFLNIHGHKYLRLDGATKLEQRQILTDRFNHDNRILCFILSTRSGGLGINLTGADTVIFYDQDWNPAMDKQCQDRCHRIGQTRDVHIYRLVSEHTIEANILRKASQKQMLDDVVIQEGEFTTDYFNKLSVQDVIGEHADVGLFGEGDAAANAAMDRVLGGVEGSDHRTATRVLEQAEDREDVAAAREAEKEIQQDDVDFMERPTPGTASGISSVRQGTPRDATPMPGRSSVGFGLFSESTPADGATPLIEEIPKEEVEYNAWGERVYTIDDYMLKTMAEQLKGTPLELPKDKKKSKKKGKDTRKR